MDIPKIHRPSHRRRSSLDSKENGRGCSEHFLTNPNGSLIHSVGETDQRSKEIGAARVSQHSRNLSFDVALLERNRSRQRVSDVKFCVSPPSWILRSFRVVAVSFLSLSLPSSQTSNSIVTDKEESGSSFGRVRENKIYRWNSSVSDIWTLGVI